MLKRRVISVGIALTLAAEIILGSITAYGAGLPLKEKSVATTAKSQSVYDPLNDPIRKALENAYAKKTEVGPTNLSNVTQLPRNFTNVASVPTNNNKQYESLSLTDLQKINRSSDKEIIVKYKDIDQRENTKKKLNTKKSKVSFKSKHWSKKFKMETIEVSDESEITNVINELKKDPNVEYAQPNYKLELLSEPSDNGFGQQWGLQNLGQIVSGQVGTTGIDINILNAWNTTKGSDEVKVAIIDTGIDINHPDLAASIYRNPNETINGLDDDGNGYVDDVNGWSFVSDTNNVFKSEAEDTHGTHIAGIIAAGINDGGVVGVSPGVKIVPLKFINGNTGFTSDAIRAIEYCQKAGIEIANVSWGGSDYNPALFEAMKNSSITFVCAAGNAGKNVDTNAVYPAAFDLSNIITVTANDNKGQLASFSNYGTKVDISAPGVNIFSTLPGNRHGYLSGTSMAAPFVTGTIALLKSIDISLGAAEIKDRILSNATISASLSGKVSTSGRLNAYAALINKAPEGETPLPNVTPTPQRPIDKSKEPSNIYDGSLEGNGKTEKPLKGENNLFVDAIINKGISNISNENGIDNLSINRMKGNFVSITWTTDVETDSVLLYGDTSSLKNKISYPELTTKHQITLKIDNIDNIRFYKVCSTSKDGKVFESSIKENTNINDLGGEPIQPLAVAEAVYHTTAQDVSTLSYVMDNGSNNSLVTAQSIGECTVFGTINGTRHDFYTINLMAGKTYSINLRGMAAEEDYDLNLLDDVLNYVGYSVNRSNYDENISFTAIKTGMYFIDIQPYTYDTVSAHHNYQLMVYSTENAADGFEPNDSKETAYTLADSILVTPTININTDEDWFVLDTTKIGKFAVTMKSIPLGCDYDIQVYDASGTLLGGSYSGDNQDEKFDGIITTPGKYFVRVYSYTSSNPTDTYEIKAGVYTTDQYEVNDNIYTVNLRNTPKIGLNSTINGTLDNQDDYDFYKFTLTSSTKVGVRLQNIPLGMDYDLLVYSYVNGEFTEVGRSTVDSNKDEVIVSQLTEGSYYIKVYSYSGSSEVQSYSLSLDDENSGEVKIEFDKTNASIGDIITARIKVKNIRNLSGYQVNLKYDPQVLDPVDNFLVPYKTSTVPEPGDILINQNYQPFENALNDFDKGILNFGKVYMGVNGYKQNGVDENTGTLAIVRFKIIKNNKIQLTFTSTDAIPGNSFGVELYDWNGAKISTGHTVRQTVTANDLLPENTTNVSSLSEDIVPGMTMSAFETYRISGCISSTVAKKDFLVKIEVGTYSAQEFTDSNGLFNLLFTPNQTGNYKITISKEGHLARQIVDIQPGSNLEIGSRSEPLSLWAGDINNDGAINMSDIIGMATRFNKVLDVNDPDKIFDLNNDNVINISDVIVVAGHFSCSTASYPRVTVVQSPRGLIGVSAGEQHSVALKENGKVLAWGRGINGQLGDGKATSSSAPVEVNLNKKIVAVSAGAYHTVFLTEEGDVYWCGGQNQQKNIPVKVDGIPSKVKAIAAGWEYTLALTESGDVYSWGDNNYGQLGNGAISVSEMIPQKVKNIAGVQAIAARGSYSVALINGEVYEWGYNPKQIFMSTPSKIMGLSNIKAIAVGGNFGGAFAVVLKEDGTAIEYGNTGARTLGVFEGAIAVAAGTNHIVIIKQDGTVYTLGENNKGQLGNGGAFSAVPVKVPGLSNVITVAAGAEHTLAVSGGTYYAWGDNAEGKLGDGSNSIRTIPSEIAIPNNVAQEDNAELDYINVGDTILDSESGKGVYGINLMFGSSVPVIQVIPKNNLATVEITPPTGLPGDAKIIVTSQSGKVQKTYWLKLGLCSYGLIEQAGEVDIYQFIPPTGDTYSFASEGKTDTYLQVYVGDTLLGTYDDNGSGNNFYGNIKLEVEKTYTLKVGHSDSTGTGSYRIIVGKGDRADLNYLLYEAYLEDLAIEAGGTYERIDSNKALVKIKYTFNIGDAEKTEEVGRVFSGKVINDKIIVSLIEFKDAFAGIFPVENSSQALSYQDSVNTLGYTLPIYPKGTTLEDSGKRYQFYETYYKDDDAKYRNTAAGISGLSSNIQRIQLLLKQLKCWVNPNGEVSYCTATGYFGDTTRASIKKFQREFMYIKEPTGKADKDTILSLIKYNLIWQLYGDGSIKPQYGVRVREYLAKWHDIDNGNDANNIGYNSQQNHVTLNTVNLEINGLKFFSSERKCYAKVNNIDSSLINYYTGVTLSNLNYTVPLKAGTTAIFQFQLKNTLSGTLDYKVDVECSRDEKVWYAKGSQYATVPGNSTKTLQYTYDIYNAGKLYTKVTVYNKEGSVKYIDLIKGTTDQVAKGDTIEKEEIDEACALIMMLDDYVRRLENTNIWFEPIDDNAIRQYQITKMTWEQSIFYLEYLLIQNQFIISNQNIHWILLNSLRNQIPYEFRSDFQTEVLDVLKTIPAFKAAWDKMEADLRKATYSMLLNFVPGLGDGKGLEEGITGKDALTGEPLAWWERALGFICLTEIRSAIKSSSFIKGASNAADVLVGIKNIEKMAEACAKASQKIRTYLSKSIDQVWEYVRETVDTGSSIKCKTVDGIEVDIPKSQLTETQRICLGTGCFAGDTIVTTRDGLKRIDEIKEGEFVLAKDVDTGTIDYKEVITVYIKSTYEFVHLNVDGEEIRTTADHLLFTDIGWWKAAENLQVGDKILNSQGEFKTLIGKSVETLQEPERIYNLNVDGFHTYFVGTNGLLVHNGCSEEMAEHLRDLVRIFDEAGNAIPYGFSSLDEYRSFVRNLRNGLPSDTRIVFQGSSVTGVSHETGALFDYGRVSDFDIGLAQDDMFLNALDADSSLGFKMKTDPNRIGPLNDAQLEYLGLKSIADKMSAQAGREVNFMLYESLSEALRRASIYVE